MSYSSTTRLSSPTVCTLYILVDLCWQVMQHFFIVFTIWFSIVNITAATKMNIAPKTSIAAGTVFVIAIWAINANTISDVLRVETIVGEMNSKDFKNSQNPNIPVTSNKWTVAIILNNLIMGILNIVKIPWFGYWWYDLPTQATATHIPHSYAVILLMLVVKNRSFSSMNVHNPAITIAAIAM